MNSTVVFYFSMFVYTAVLIWGLKLLHTSFSDPKSISKLLSDRTDNNNEEKWEPNFSKLAGAIGAIGLASIFIAIGYWVIFTLFLPDGDLSRLEDLGIFFLSGSSLFAPYAFNQLSRIFKS
ncbi:MAG: hypothetical protein SV765_00285 [Pseudomonadota bacterium]|nr:hypothetical protein [Pseudomonadota bacterium]